MSLDFTQVDVDRKLVGHVSIKIELHGKIFYSMKPEKFLLLERIRDYYSDVLYEVEELDDLKNELIKLKCNHLNSFENISLLDSMIKLVEEACLKNYRIEVIAD